MLTAQIHLYVLPMLKEEIWSLLAQYVHVVDILFGRIHSSYEC